MTLTTHKTYTQETKIGDILEFVKFQEVPYLEEVRCVAIYEGPPIPEGEKSVSLRFWYRAEDRTLLDEEVNEIQEALAKKIFEKFSAKPRQFMKTITKKDIINKLHKKIGLPKKTLHFVIDEFLEEFRKALELRYKVKMIRF